MRVRKKIDFEIRIASYYFLTIKCLTGFDATTEVKVEETEEGDKLIIREKIAKNQAQSTFPNNLGFVTVPKGRSEDIGLNPPSVGTE